MAEAAKPNEPVTKEQLEAFMDRYAGFEEQAATIMGEAMNDCKNGPRAAQKELRDEMKGAGIRMKAFNALWAIRKAQDKLGSAISELEDDDREQFQLLADQLSQEGEDADFDEQLSLGAWARQLAKAGN
jgi:uncharacterized protein (UPF0335 family)